MLQALEKRRENEEEERISAKNLVHMKTKEDIGHAERLKTRVLHCKIWKMSMIKNVIVLEKIKRNKSCYFLIRGNFW